MPTCVLDGSYGTVGGASIIFPDVGQARRLAEHFMISQTVIHQSQTELQHLARLLEDGL